jgi:hypothetical protein
MFSILFFGNASFCLQVEALQNNLCASFTNKILMHRQKDFQRKYSNWTGMQLSLFHPLGTVSHRVNEGGTWNNTIKIY